MNSRETLCVDILSGNDNNALIQHFLTELEPMFTSGSEYDEAIADDLLDIARVFATQGHSGFSAAYMISVLQQLLDYKPLTALTGKPDEWKKLPFGLPDDCNAEWVNKRLSSVFMNSEGIAYDTDAITFREPDGFQFYNGIGIIPITFPYMPSTVIVHVPQNSTREQRIEAVKAVTGKTPIYA